MRITLSRIIAILALVLLFGCDSTGSRPSAVSATQPGERDHGEHQTRAAAPTDAGKVQPLGEGRKAPVAAVRGVDGRQVDLAALYKQKPSVLIFYRGGWCPFCNAHLAQIATAQEELVSLGYQVLAVSPDRPAELAKTLDKKRLTYRLLSDSDVALARAFGLVFRVDDPTIEKYRGFGIDLEQASGQDHHLLPIPAVYIVDTAGVIRFAHWDPDYKKRLAPAALLAAARKVVGAAEGEAGKGNRE